MTRFRLRTRADPGLPRLAWCARARARSAEIEVRHGRDVELSERALVEGAWDGDFRAMAFADATFMAGTGLSVADDRLRFVAGSGWENRIYAARRGEDLFVSNSLSFTLVAVGDGPDPKRDHAGDVKRQLLHSLDHRLPHRLSFRHHDVEVFEMRNLEVDSALTLTSVPQVAPPEPRSYRDVVSQLEGTIARVAANATDSARRRGYEPLITLSRGYDSVALAALVARLGWHEAITFCESTPGVGDPHDDGTRIGQCLGLNVAGRARLAWRARTDLPEAEACATPPAMALQLASIEDDIAGRLVITGQYGDAVFATRDVTRRRRSRASASSQELRLRVGLIYCSPIHTLRAHIPAIIAISNSEELAPFRLGGDYDRPIPRRMGEQAGVPRDLFGRNKIAGMVSEVRWEHQLSTTSRRDFAAFVATTPGLAPVAGNSLRRIANQGLRIGRRALGRGLRRMSLPAPPKLGDWPVVDDPRLFHWGFAHTRRRYDGRTP